MAYQCLPVELPAKSSVDSDTKVSNISSETFLLPNRQSNILLFTKIMGVVLSLLLLSFISGCSKETENVTSPNIVSQGGNSMSTATNPQPNTPSQLEQADNYFNQGNYDAALSLYRTINTDYAQRRTHAIECITVSQEVAQEWLDEVDDEVGNGMILAAFGWDFDFDTAYDVENYTFYTKMGWPEIYTSVAAISGLSQSEVSEGMTSSGHEKMTYKLFYDRGYKDITCISLMLDSEENILAEYPYGLAEYEADLVAEQQALEAKAQEEAAKAQEEKERLERRAEFISNINSNEAFLAAAHEKVEEKRDSIFELVQDFFLANKDCWPYEATYSFKAENITYGELTVDDSKHQDEVTQYCYVEYELRPVVIVHLPCTVEAEASVRDPNPQVRIFSDPEEISKDVCFEMLLDVVLLADPDNLDELRLAEKNAWTVVSIEETTPALPEGTTPEGQDQQPVTGNMQESGYIPGGGQGYLGDTLHTIWFDFTVEDAYTCQSYGSYTAGNGKQLVVVDMTVQNTFPEEVPMGRYDFQIQWSEVGEDDYAWPLAAAGEEQLPDEYYLGINEERSGILVYEVPAGEVDFSVSIAEYFENGTKGDVYFVFFTADTSNGALA